MNRLFPNVVAGALGCLTALIAVTVAADEPRPVLSAEETEGLYLIRREVGSERKTRKRLTVSQFVPQVRVPALPDETEPPVIHIDELKTEVAAPQLTISGKVEDASGVALVEVNGEIVSFDTDGNFSTEIELDPGVNRISVLATDSNLNESEATVEIRLIAS